MRWGSGNYLAPAVAFFNLVLLISLRFGIYGNAFILLAIIILVGLSSASIIIGHLHRIWQQDTDALLENAAVIREIVRQVLEGKKAIEDATN